MKIELHHVTIREIVKDYQNLWEQGVFGYSGNLDIRPPYQREFVYKDKQRESVIDTIRKEFPLNVLYRCKIENDKYEVLDGQQRIISICQYTNNDFSVNFSWMPKTFANLSVDQQEKILDYKLMIYFCEGEDSEKLEWFRTINIAGEKLTEQELRNAVYTWPWLSDAKLKFMKGNSPAYLLGNKFIDIEANQSRGKWLQTVLSWISKGQIENYMSKNQYSKDADELWQYFQDVIAWIKKLFITYRKEMKGIDRGELYNYYKTQSFNANDIEKEVEELMKDVEVGSKKGIYYYLFDRQERHLNLRAFDDAMKRTIYEDQHGICSTCKQHFKIEEMEGDHITPRVEGGKTNIENLQMLCKECNRRKSSK